MKKFFISNYYDKRNSFILFYPDITYLTCIIFVRSRIRLIRYISLFLCSHLITNYHPFSNMPGYIRLVITSMNSSPMFDNSAFDIVDADTILFQTRLHSLSAIISLGTPLLPSPFSPFCASSCAFRFSSSFTSVWHSHSIATSPLSHVAYYMHRCEHCLRCIL